MLTWRLSATGLESSPSFSGNTRSNSWRAIRRTRPRTAWWLIWPTIPVSSHNSPCHIFLVTCMFTYLLPVEFLTTVRRDYKIFTTPRQFMSGASATLETTAATAPIIGRIEMDARVPRALAISLALLPFVALHAGGHAIDAANSRMTVHVSKSGVFSALGHDHDISAPVKSGSVDAEAK